MRPSDQVQGLDHQLVASGVAWSEATPPRPTCVLTGEAGLSQHWVLRRQTSTIPASVHTHKPHHMGHAA